MEDLNGIRNGNRSKGKGKRMNKRLHAWPYRKLQQFLRYKLEWIGLSDSSIPRKSRRCPLCSGSGTESCLLAPTLDMQTETLPLMCLSEVALFTCAHSASMRLPNFRMWKLRRNESGAWGCVSQPLPAGWSRLPPLKGGRLRSSGSSGRKPQASEGVR